VVTDIYFLLATVAVGFAISARTFRCK